VGGCVLSSLLSFWLGIPFVWLVEEELMLVSRTPGALKTFFFVENIFFVGKLIHDEE
jgi:hypothetical protein